MDGNGSGTALPPWQSVLAVVAHPDDESFGLGAVLDAFVTAGAQVAVLCLTHGEASTLHGVDGDLRRIREAELRAAGSVLGISSIRLESYPDGELAGVDLDELGSVVADAVEATGAEGLVVFDVSGVTGHPDHARATQAALIGSETRGLGVLAWTLPDDVPEVLAGEFGVAFTGHAPAEVDVVLRVSRARQLDAVTCHPSQAVPGSVLWRRLELLGDREHLRWLRR